MKIVQFMASQKWGGAEKVFVDVSNELSGRHHVVAILLRDTEYKNRFSPLVNIVELRSHPTSHNPFLLLELYRNLKKINGDIVHTHAVKASVLVNKVSHFLKLKHIATKHNARKGRIFNRLKWVTTVSMEGEKSVKGDGSVRVIRNGIKPQKSVGSVDNQIFRMLAVGRLDAIKGFDVLIEQMQNFPDDFSLSIAGEGPENKNLFNKIRECGLEDRVFLLGFRDDIADLMKQSHVVVISSYSEGFPQVMIEALFYGNVLISTAVGGVKEVLPDLFLASQESLGKKLKDVVLNYSYYREQFGLLQKAEANKYHLNNICHEYEIFYTSVLS